MKRDYLLRDMLSGKLKLLELEESFNEREKVLKKWRLCVHAGIFLCVLSVIFMLTSFPLLFWVCVLVAGISLITYSERQMKRWQDKNNLMVEEYASLFNYCQKPRHQFIDRNIGKERFKLIQGGKNH